MQIIKLHLYAVYSIEVVQHCLSIHKWNFDSSFKKIWEEDKNFKIKIVKIYLGNIKGKHVRVIFSFISKSQLIVEIQRFKVTLETMQLRL